MHITVVDSVYKIKCSPSVTNTLTRVLGTVVQCLETVVIEFGPNLSPSSVEAADGLAHYGLRTTPFL